MRAREKWSFRLKADIGLTTFKGVKVDRLNQPVFIQGGRNGGKIEFTFHMYSVQESFSYKMDIEELQCGCALTGHHQMSRTAFKLGLATAPNGRQELVLRRYSDGARLDGVVYDVIDGVTFGGMLFLPFHQEVNSHLERPLFDLIRK